MKKVTARRTATVLAGLGMLVMSSGIALMVTVSPAAAAVKVNVCHATSSDTNPYVFLQVDDDSTQLQAHLMHRSNPNKKWKSAGVFLGVAHVKGDPKPDLIGSYTDSAGVFHQLDGNITSETCAGQVVEVLTTATVTFTDPTCANENTASYSTTGPYATFEVTSGTVAPGQAVTVTATVKDGYVFANDAQSLVFTHTFAAAQDCSTVSPPTVTPPAVSPPKATPETTVATPKVVHAGLVSAATQRFGGQDGLALLVAGMIIMVIAAGLGTVRPDGGTNQI